MRNVLVGSLTLAALLMSGAAGAATVRWHPGEWPPPTEIAPASPSQIGTVTFTAAMGFNTYGNNCEAENWLGEPSISADLEAREFSVEFTPRPIPPYYCLPVWLPVNGIEGELGKLEPGEWKLTITNINIGLYMELPFTVIAVPTASGKLIIHTLANDQTSGTAFPFDRPFFIARPLDSRCNPVHGGTACGIATLQQGAPLVGTIRHSPTPLGYTSGFALPRNFLAADATGSLPLYEPYEYISTYAASLRNGPGFFGPWNGPGTRSFTLPGHGGPGARIAINPGARRFGGTLHLLGLMGSTRAHRYKNRTYVGSANFMESVLGASCTAAGCMRPPTYPTTTAYMKYQTTMGKATTVYMTPWGLPWTTGTVSVTATAGSFPTRFQRRGYDNRTGKGQGTIQLVAPHLVKWDFKKRDAPWDRHAGAIGILRIKFVPEPSGWAVLAAGLVFAAVFYRRHDRRSHAR